LGNKGVINKADIQPAKTFVSKPKLQYGNKGTICYILGNKVVQPNKTFLV